MRIKKYDTLFNKTTLSVCMFTCLFVFSSSIPLFAQSELWNPPVFQTVDSSKPIKIVVESIPISKQADVTALGNELQNRIALQFKNVEPKWILLSADEVKESDYNSIIKTVSDRFSHAIVIAVTSSTVFTHKTTSEDNPSSICIFAIGGGNLKFSATVADKTLDEFESDDAIVDYLSQSLLRTTRDQAVFFFSTFLDEQTNTIIDKFKQKRITKDSSAIPIGLLMASGNSKAVYFAGRRTPEAIIAISISGDIAIDVVNDSDSVLSTLAKKIEYLEQSGLGIDGVLASPVHDLGCIKYKSVLQKHVGKLTPVWGLSNNDSGQIVLFSTPM